MQQLTFQSLSSCKRHSFVLESRHLILELWFLLVFTATQQLNQEWLFLVRFDFYQKKITKPVFFFKKTKIEPKLFQTDRFRFGYFRTKTGFFNLTRFFQFNSVFLFGSVFFSFFSVWVRFCFFGFRLIKPKPNRSVFKNSNRFNRFFSWFGFFCYFF